MASEIFTNQMLVLTTLMQTPVPQELSQIWLHKSTLITVTLAQQVSCVPREPTFWPTWSNLAPLVTIAHKVAMTQRRPNVPQEPITPTQVLPQMLSVYIAPLESTVMLHQQHPLEIALLETIAWQVPTQSVMEIHAQLVPIT